MKDPAAHLFVKVGLTQAHRPGLWAKTLGSGAGWGLRPTPLPTCDSAMTSGDSGSAPAIAAPGEKGFYDELGTKHEGMYQQIQCPGSGVGYVSLFLEAMLAPDCYIYPLVVPRIPQINSCNMVHVVSPFGKLAFCALR